jgi:CBS domain-containing protein
MATAKDLLRTKENAAIVTIAPQASVLEALKLMAEHNIGALLVLSDGGGVEGILTERDVVRKLDLGTPSPGSTPVSKMMTPRVLYVEGTQSLDECMALMNDKNIRHLPVYEDGQLLGMISVRDVLRHLISEKDVIISQLEHYIRGER